MTTQRVEVVAKSRASLEALASRLGLRNPLKVHVSSQLWTATFLSKEDQERRDIEQQLSSLGY